MKITDFKIIEAGSIEQLTELVKAELPQWSVVGSLTADRIPLTSPDESTGEYSRTVFRIPLGLEQAAAPIVEPQRLDIGGRIIEGAEAKPAAANKKKTTTAKAKS